jgi:hypothetical protein
VCKGAACRENLRQLLLATGRVVIVMKVVGLELIGGAAPPPPPPPPALLGLSPCCTPPSLPLISKLKLNSELEKRVKKVSPNNLGLQAYYLNKTQPRVCLILLVMAKTRVGKSCFCECPILNSASVCKQRLNEALPPSRH